MESIPDLNKQQLHFLQDTSFLISKHAIIQQLQELLALTEKTLVQQVSTKQTLPLPPNCLKSAGKISRGENYKGLPYLVLDYPRLFQRQDIFVFRSMCWWGHFFSCTLHLQGSLLDRYRDQLKENLPVASLPADTYLCLNESPWEYHYGPDNYHLLQELPMKELLQLLDRDFVKISRKIPLEQYQQFPSFASQCFRDFMGLLR